MADIETLIKLAPALFQKDTASKPDSWDSKNPSSGHCAVISLLVQDNLGGQIERLGFIGTRWEQIGSHYRNVLPSGLRFDLTIGQFGKDYPPEYFPTEIRTRESILANPNTLRRYELIKSRFNQLTQKQKS